MSGRETELLVGLRLWHFGGQWQRRSRYSNTWMGNPVALHFRPGMTVLYGRNGAGKSTVINALRSALTGVRASIPVELYVRLPTESRDFGVEGQSRRHVYPRLPIETKRSMNGVPLDLEALLSAAQYDWSTRCDAADRSLAEAAVRSDRLAVIPVGSEGAPQWQVWLAADPYRPEMRPWVERSKARLLASDKAYQDWAEHDEDDDLREQFDDTIWELVSDPLFSIAWTRPGDEPITRFDYLDDMRQRQETLGIPTGPHDGLPIPVARLATSERLDWPRPLFEVEEGVLQAMLDHARTRTEYGHGTSELPTIAKRTQHIEADARTFYPLMLGDCPALWVADGRYATWRSAGQYSWAAGPVGSFRPMRHLSAAENRWARFAAMLATGLDGPPIVDFTTPRPEWPESLDEDAARVLILDEPELHLHRSAEHHMAEGLRTLAHDTVDYVFVATHAPDLLNVPGVNLYWVTNGTLKEFTGATLQDLDALGLNPSDLLSITRVVVLVEGHHDQLVLERLIGDRLRRAHAHLIPLDGGSRLADVVDSQILFDFTQAHVIGLLDNLDPTVARDAYLEAERLLLEEGPSSAIAVIDRLIPGRKSSEFVYLNKWLKRALTRQDGFPYSRFTPWGLTKPDIIDYLPVQQFVPNAESWDALHRTHQELLDSGQTKIGNFKKWAEKTHNTDFTDARINTAIASMDYIPEEFIALADECERVARAAPNEVGL